VLGTNAEVKTLYGSSKVDIPPGSSDGQVMRLKGQGVTKLAPNQHQKGDHLITFKVVMPTKLSKEQKEIFEKLRDLENKKEN
jgi:molecular chaperone DnaJ